MAAISMNQAGVDGAALRGRITGIYPSKPAAKKINKVPFSVEGKQCLEQSLRAALALGHNYIGTEHLFFGVQRQAETNNQSLDDLLGVSAAEIHRRLIEILGGAGSGPAMRSPGLHAALDRARFHAGQSPMTTGHVLAGTLADPDSQVSHALASIGVDPRRVQAALDAVNVAETSDASPAARSVAITVGETTTVIADPDVAIALQQLSAEQLRDIIKKAIDRPEPGQAAG
jgi:ATP-dependent Clp protease ATP-binding subunit ClpA